MSSLTNNELDFLKKSENEDSGSDSGVCSDEENSEAPSIKETPLDNNYEHLPNFLRNLFSKGAQEPIDFSVSLNDKPKWLDIEKFKRGQKFAAENLIGPAMADVLSIFLMFSLKPALLPLMFTGCTDTPFKCYKRYLYTFIKASSWYKEDMWTTENNKAKSNLSFVKTTHKKVFEKINACCKDEFDKKISLAARNPNFKLTYKDAISEDAKKNSPHSYLDTYPKKGDVWMSQASMSLTQFTFVGLFATYPKSFGAHSATEENFDDFVHMWRGLGYLLGIKDEYNFCNGNLSTVRQRTKALIEYVFKPSLKNLTDDWEYMSRCVVDGSRFYAHFYYFESNLLLLFHILKMDMPKFRSLVPFYQLFIFYALRFFLYFLIRLPYVAVWSKKWVERKIDFAVNAPPKAWAEWKKKEFPYVEKNNNI